MSRIMSTVALLVSLAIFALACGADNSAVVAVGASSTAAPGAGTVGDETPIPVEPDGGIGDGAEPLPGAPQPTSDGDWHGREVAETNCPGTKWQRVEASAFSFSVPVDFIDQQPQGIDSEVGSWSNGSGIDVSFDYGWYTGSLSQFPGVELTDIDYSGVIGMFGLVRAAADDATANSVAVYFPQVASVGDQWSALGLTVSYQNPDDEIIGRCIVGSIEWTAT